MAKKERQLQTISYIHNPQSILLAMKLRGFGKGRWNGYGGKVNPGETIYDAAVRETWEEGEIHVKGLEKKGIIDFDFKEGLDKILEVHIYNINEYSGTPRRTEEMSPAWFNINYIPYNHMWPADKIWLPLFLTGKKFQGEVHFKNMNEVLSHNIEIVNSLRE